MTKKEWETIWNDEKKYAKSQQEYVKTLTDRLVTAEKNAEFYKTAYEILLNGTKAGENSTGFVYNGVVYKATDITLNEIEGEPKTLSVCFDECKIPG